MFAAIQKYWTGERWIRVTDDDGLAQFIQINGQQQDPMTGQQQIVNALGSVDVDIILDEGPDTINAAGRHVRDAQGNDAGALRRSWRRRKLRPWWTSSSSPHSCRARPSRNTGRPVSSNSSPIRCRQAVALEMQEKAAVTKDKLASAGLKQAQTQKTVVETNCCRSTPRTNR
jgi:hypothetical protein